MGVLVAALAAVGGLAGRAEASLVLQNSFQGRVGLTTDGLGTSSGSGSFQTEVAAGSQVQGAYIYAQRLSLATWATSPTITFAGVALSNAVLLDGGNTAVFDVTSIVQAQLNPAQATQTWSMVENTDLQGSGLAIVYSNASLAEGGVVLYAGGIVDLNANVNFNQNLALPSPIGPTGAVKLAVGIDFSFQSPASPDQRSTFNINGTRLTSNAGGNDDGQAANNALVTFGGTGDSLANPANPLSTSDPDDELYDLRPFVSVGDTSINFSGSVASQDRLFFAGVQYETIQPSAVPEPSTLALTLAAALTVGLARLRGRQPLARD